MGKKSHRRCKKVQPKTKKVFLESNKTAFEIGIYRASQQQVAPLPAQVSRSSLPLLTRTADLPDVVIYYLKDVSKPARKRGSDDDDDAGNADIEEYSDLKLLEEFKVLMKTSYSTENLKSNGYITLYFSIMMRTFPRLRDLLTNLLREIGIVILDKDFSEWCIENEIVIEDM